MSTQPKRYITPDDYLKAERAAEFKSEYFAGEVFAMTGATRRHNLVVGNLAGNLSQQLKACTCEVYASRMRVKVSATGLYTYPDVVVVCGEPLFEDGHQDTLLNPTLLIEAFSKSTENYDRGKKFGHYRRVESLQEYLLIAQDQPQVEHYLRRENNQWLLSEAAGLDAVLRLPSIECTLSLAEVYEKVRFDAPENRAE